MRPVQQSNNSGVKYDIITGERGKFWYWGQRQGFANHCKPDNFLAQSSCRGLFRTTFGCDKFAFLSMTCESWLWPWYLVKKGWHHVPDDFQRYRNTSKRLLGLKILWHSHLTREVKRVQRWRFYMLSLVCLGASQFSLSGQNKSPSMQKMQIHAQKGFVTQSFAEGIKKRSWQRYSHYPH